MSEVGRQCSAINSKGELCHCSAIHGSSPPRCVFHIDRRKIPTATPSAPLTVEEELQDLTAEYRRLVHSRKKSLECTRLLLMVREAIKELGGMPPSSTPAKKDDPEWMKKFRQS